MNRSDLLMQEWTTRMDSLMTKMQPCKLPPATIVKSKHGDLIHIDDAVEFYRERFAELRIACTELSEQIGETAAERKLCNALLEELLADIDAQLAAAITGLKKKKARRRP